MTQQHIPTGFCVAPFKAAAIDTNGNMIPCCEYIQDRDKAQQVQNIVQWWNKDIKNFRKELIEGKTDQKECTHCRSKEKLKSINLRKYLNSFFQSTINQIIDDYKNGISPNIEYIEIRVSNYCNLKCIMCGPYASSQIAAEYLRNKDAYHSINMVGAYEPTIRWWENEQIKDDFIATIKQASIINFGGGEPLIVPQVVEICNKLDPFKVKFLKFNTNLTILTKSFLDSISKFRSVQIDVSLEGINEHNNYIRYGSDWQSIHNNISILKQIPNVNLNISHTLQHTSLYSLPNLIEYAQQQGIKINLHEVYYGSYPSPGVLTINSAKTELVESFLKWLRDFNGVEKLTLMNWVNNYQFDSELNTKFVQYTNMLDKIRGCNFNKTFRK
jgi:radical SAM protein with 4Fe4S-binding SPASM domain